MYTPPLLVTPEPPTLLLKVLFVRHGHSCANAWKAKGGAYSTYKDPELTKMGIELCRDRKPVLQDALETHFPGNSYKIGTSSLMRTQETAYYMLIEGTSKKYSIFPHIAEDGMGANNYPFDPEIQKDKLAEHLGVLRDSNRGTLSIIDRDFRGETDYAHKSNWPMFLQWFTKLSETDREELFHKEEKEGQTTYNAVIFTHGRFLRRNLGFDKKAVQNNDIFFARIDASNQRILEKAKLTTFAIPDEKRSDATGCRIQRALTLLNPFGRTRRRKARSRKSRRVYMRK
jgi:broad specificity phosphatase PhoE